VSRAREPRLLLLHGFLSSRNAWGPLQRQLSDVPTTAPDMLGYGMTAHDGGDYTLEAMVKGLRPLIESERPTHVIGHSMGGIVALALPREFESIEAVGVIGLPVFKDREDGTRFLHSRGLIYRNFLRGDRVAHYACMGLHRTSRAWLPLAPLILPRQPREVLRTTFDHCPGSHSGSLDGVVFAGLVEDLAAKVGAPVFALHGSRDRTAPLERAREIASQQEWDFRIARNVGHQLPIERPRVAARWVRDYVLRADAGAQRDAGESRSS
jgi:pimeloyl-ACP methyl ester carboxylesterase